ncbi:MAG TPA: hypothetical protein VMJ13_10595 [Candidatus Acidoferrum sp.]|nr:hypothetical protein [Candidatus Acidoferrum sp.]
MNTTKIILGGAALLVFAAPSVFAQNIQDRKDNQQDRIAQGVQSGQLTAGETKRLETKEAGLNKEEHTMRSEDNGHLTAADRAKLDRQQNRLSNRIYDDKHNARVQHDGPGEVGQRKENQQDRIAQGIQSGQLRPGETAKLEKQQQGINREERGMREANGGKLTGADKRALNQQQNQASRNIYAKKHNGRTR